MTTIHVAFSRKISKINNIMSNNKLSHENLNAENLVRHTTASGPYMRIIADQRRQTRNKIYKYIYYSSSPVSKSQIAYDLNYSLPTVHKNLSELLSAGLITVGDLQKSTGGRPPAVYVVVPNAGYALGIAVTANHLRFLLLDIKQNQISYKRLALDAINSLDIASKIDEELDKFITENKINPAKIIGVGITIPGVIDHERELVIFSPSMKLKNLALSEITKNIHYPVYIENDATAAGFAEWSALTREKDNHNFVFVYLLLENGIGGAIIINGKPWLGDTHKSAEFGHMCIHPGGLTCNCGKKGCLEAYCSAFRFTRDIGVNIENFFIALKDGNKEYAEIWDDVLSNLALAIHNLRLAFDTDIILGGFVSEYLNDFLLILKQRVSALNPFEENTDFIKIAKFPRRAGMIGAAWHFIDEFLSQV